MSSDRVASATSSAASAFTGLIERIPRTHRYRVTDRGLRVALFFTRAYARLLRPGFAQLLAGISPTRAPIRRALDQFQLAIDRSITDANLVA